MSQTHGELPSERRPSSSLRSMRKPTTADDESLLFGFDRYLKEYTPVSDATIVAYENDLRLFAAFLKPRLIGLETTTPADCDEYVSQLQTTVLKPKTVRRKATALRHFLEFLHAARAVLGTRSHQQAYQHARGTCVSTASREIRAHEAIAQFIASIQGTMSSHTVRAYSGDLAKFAAFLNDAPAADVDEHRVDAFLGDLHHKNLSVASQRRHAAALRTFCAWLLKQGVLSHNPVAGRYLKGNAEKESLVPQESKVRAVLEASSSSVRKRDRLILVLLYAAGLRSSEVVSLDVEDVNVRRRRLTIAGHKLHRYVHVQEDVIAALQAYLPERNALLAIASEPNNALVLNYRGRRLTVRSLTRIVQKLSDVCDLRIQPRNLRHAHAVHALRGGAELHQVRHALGLTGATSTAKLSRMRGGL